MLSHVHYFRCGIFLVTTNVKYSQVRRSNQFEELKNEKVCLKIKIDSEKVSGAIKCHYVWLSLGLHYLHLTEISKNIFIFINWWEFEQFESNWI